MENENIQIMWRRCGIESISVEPLGKTASSQKLAQKTKGGLRQPRKPPREV